MGSFKSVQPTQGVLRGLIQPSTPLLQKNKTSVLNDYFSNRKSVHQQVQESLQHYKVRFVFITVDKEEIQDPDCTQVHENQRVKSLFNRVITWIKNQGWQGEENSIKLRFDRTLINSEGDQSIKEVFDNHDRREEVKLEIFEAQKKLENSADS